MSNACREQTISGDICVHTSTFFSETRLPSGLSAAPQVLRIFAASRESSSVLKRAFCILSSDYCVFSTNFWTFKPMSARFLSDFC